MNLPLRFALRYLFARKSHNVINIISGISVAGMAIGTAALVIILSVFNGFNDLVRNTLGDIEPDILVKPANAKVFVPDSVAAERLYALEEIHTLSSVLEEQAFLSYDGRQSLARVKGVDSVYEEESPLRNHMTDGDFTLHKGQRPMAVVGSALAWNMEINPHFLAPVEIYYPERSGTISLANPTASLRSTRTGVAGLFSLNAEVDGELVLVPIEVMRQVLDYDEEISALEIRLAPGATEKEVHQLITKVSAIMGPSFRVMDRYHQNETLYKMMRYEKLAIYMILIFVVLVIAFNIFSSLSMLIIEKKGDIETLRSLGAPETMTRRIFRLEGWLISLLGLGIGLVVGIGFVLLQQHFGLIRMPGNYIVHAYPVILKAGDLLWTVAGVAAVGYFIAILPSLMKTNSSDI